MNTFFLFTVAMQRLSGSLFEYLSSACSPWTSPGGRRLSVGQRRGPVKKLACCRYGTWEIPLKLTSRGESGHCCLGHSRTKVQKLLVLKYKRMEYKKKHLKSSGFTFTCQALVLSPVLLNPKPIPNQLKIKIQVQLGLGWHYNHIGHHPTTTTPQLLSMKECSREKVLKGKKSQYDPHYPPRCTRWTAIQWDQGHG